MAHPCGYRPSTCMYMDSQEASCTVKKPVYLIMRIMMSYYLQIKEHRTAPMWIEHGSGGCFPHPALLTCESGDSLKNECTKTSQAVGATILDCFCDCWRNYSSGTYYLGFMLLLADLPTCPKRLSNRVVAYSLSSVDIFLVKVLTCEGIRTAVFIYYQRQLAVHERGSFLTSDLKSVYLDYCN